MITTCPYGIDMTSTTAQQLAESVVADGFAAHSTAVAAFLAASERRGADPVLLSIAGDAAEPEVARLRALGRLVVDFATSSSLRSEIAATPPTQLVACGASAA